MRQVELHPVLGMEVLKRMNFLPKGTLDIILHHLGLDGLHANIAPNRGSPSRLTEKTAAYPGL